MAQNFHQLRPMRIEESLVTALAVSCIVSAGLLAAAPRATTHALGMPPGRALGRALALRDATIGVALLRRSSRRRALALRQLSDAFDAGLAAAAMARGRKGSAPLVTFAGALALSAGSWLLRSTVR
jgi:hypothetical protein